MWNRRGQVTTFAGSPSRVAHRLHQALFAVCALEPAEERCQLSGAHIPSQAAHIHLPRKSADAPEK